MRLLLKMRAISLLGVTIDVIIHLKTSLEPVEARLEPELRSAVLELYCKEILESRTAVPAHVLVRIVIAPSYLVPDYLLQKSLDLYIRTYVDSSAFDVVVLPALEKALSKGVIIGKSKLSFSLAGSLFFCLKVHALSYQHTPNQYPFRHSARCCHIS